MLSLRSHMYFSFLFLYLNFKKLYNFLKQLMNVKNTLNLIINIQVENVMDKIIIIV